MDVARGMDEDKGQRVECDFRDGISLNSRCVGDVIRMKGKDR